MIIEKIIIENFKCYEGRFELELNKGLNILVGDNEAGKSTILEAIHLALSGWINGRYLNNELSEYLFNHNIVTDYLSSLERNQPEAPPHILIEIYINGDDFPLFEGNGNSMNVNYCGFSLKINFDEKYRNEYEYLIKTDNIKSLPIEYYNYCWSSFARDSSITPRTIPIKSALIDSASSRYKNGSDIYISRIIKDFLDPKEIVDVSQAHRKMKEVFREEEAIKGIDEKIRNASKISDKNVELSVVLSSRDAWKNNLMTYLDEIPFHHIGKGEQCIIKTKLALGHKKTKEANILLFEEPENHLSHSKLNQLIYDIKAGSQNKQILISTHNSYVANKLGLESLILLNEFNITRLTDLNKDTETFFRKLSGYDTLRLILSKEAILVEGDSDELIVQKAYQNHNGNKLPIEDGIDVISVGVSFLRFLEIADRIKKKVTVVTDNDGDLETINRKYQDYLGDNAKDHIRICFDSTVDTGELAISGKPFNYNTLEPKILKENNLDLLNKIFNTAHETEDDMHKYMQANKTICALRIFETEEEINFPQYILDSFQPLTFEEQ